MSSTGSCELSVFVFLDSCGALINQKKYLTTPKEHPLESNGIGVGHAAIKGSEVLVKLAPMPSSKRRGVPGKSSLPADYVHPPEHVLTGQTVPPWMQWHTPMSFGQLSMMRGGPGSSTTGGPASSVNSVCLRYERFAEWCVLWG